MRRFYREEDIKVGEMIDIGGSEARHIKDVLRLKVGTPIVLFDRSGMEFDGKIAKIGRGSVKVNILRAREGGRESALEIILGQGIPKSDKMDLIVQKGTELGVSSIVPLFTERVVPRSFGPNKLERWKRIAVEACKQSRRAKVPYISEPVTLEEFVVNADSASLRLLLWEGEKGTSLKDVLPVSLSNRSIFLIIGPEGGLSEDEASLSKRHGFIPVSIGRRILRTETVSLTLLSIIQFLHGDLA